MVVRLQRPPCALNDPQTLTQCLTWQVLIKFLQREWGDNILSLDPHVSGGCVQIGALRVIPIYGAGHCHQADAYSGNGTQPALYSYGGWGRICTLPLTLGRLAAPVPWPLPMFIWLSLFMKLFFSESSLRAEAEQDTSGPPTPSPGSGPQQASFSAP